MPLINIILPAIITVVGNVLFYLWIKEKVDSSIERQKIAYSGIFKERIDIYKEILRQIFDIKSSIQQYQYSGMPESVDKIMLDINKFINFYLINQPFLSKKMLEELSKIRSEFQEVFDNFYLHHSLSKVPNVEVEERNERMKKYFASGNKLKKNSPFKDLEETIITEMKEHLHIEH